MTNHTPVILRNKPPETKPWTSRELAELRRLAPLGAATVAALLERSIASVKMAAHRHRISLRPEGERRGLVLGQPRSGSLVSSVRRIAFLRQLREDVLAGKADVVRMERRIRAITHGASLCPRCSVRPVEIERTGLCEDCHVEELAWAHALEADRTKADRLLLRERQRKSRAKKET